MSEFDNLKASIGKKIKELRFNSGLTIEDLTNELDISFSNYFYLEKGSKHAPSLDTLYKLAEFYHVPIGYFFQDQLPPAVPGTPEQQKLLLEFSKLNKHNKNFCLYLLTTLNKSAKRVWL
ncbi:MAG: helix-turn-helix domain-containing protein [Candidatus Margulisbacteria bacterium]|jgi:transcriptional regulator with XRE-family HTH domain|nr:helix-turn-helix domain-containing protein [Candidatus Margulisiibacteriota bacterium]